MDKGAKPPSFVKNEASASENKKSFGSNPCPAIMACQGTNKAFGFTLTHTRNLTKPDMHRLQVGPRREARTMTSQDGCRKCFLSITSFTSQISTKKMGGHRIVFFLTHHMWLHAATAGQWTLLQKFPKTEAPLQAKHIKSHWYCRHLAPTNVHIEVWPQCLKWQLLAPWSFCFVG